MARIAVAIYLVLATAVGPWPCCCWARPGSPRPTAADPPGSPRPATCCHAVKSRPTESLTGPTRAAAAEDRPGEQTPPAPCPCDRHSCAAKARPDLTRPTTFSSHSLEPSPAAGVWVPPGPPVTNTATARDLDSDRPSLSAADRLYAHHVLRC